MRVILLCLSLCMFACSPFPRDEAGTTDRIKRTHVMRVGLVAGTGDWSAAREVADDLAARYGASIETRTGPAARLLRDLEEGRTDLIVGEFGRSGPESKEASLSRAVGQPEPRDGKEPVLRLARRKGENAVITASDKLVMP